MKPEDGTTATLESPAPAETTTAVESPAAAPEAAVTSASPAADVYDDAYQEHLAEEPAADAARPEPEAKTEAPATTATDPKQENGFLTEGEKQVLGRSKITPEQLKGLPREALDSVIGTLRDQQTEQDRLRSELGRFKKEDAPAAPAKPAAEQQASPYSKQVDDTIAKIATSYDDEIKPMGDLFKTLHTDIDQVRESTRALPIMMELMNELVIDQALSGLASDYPSITNPESRQKVADRFLTEWNSGAYVRDGVKFGQAIKNAARSAAKVVFNTTTEASAAANLVKTNKDRLASQPKVGSQVAGRKGPQTENDVYSSAYHETIGKELGR